MNRKLGKLRRNRRDFGKILTQFTALITAIAGLLKVIEEIGKLLRWW